MQSTRQLSSISGTDIPVLALLALRGSRRPSIDDSCRVDCAGFTLIEVLVSLMLLSIMLLSLDAVNLSSLRLAKASWHDHLVELQVDNKIEMQRAGVIEYEKAV